MSKGTPQSRKRVIKDYIERHYPKSQVGQSPEPKEECIHEPLIDTGVGYYHCPACNKGFTYDEWAKGQSPEGQDELERIICAAIWYHDQPTAKILPKNIDKGVVVAGHRHGHCIQTFVSLTGKRSVTTEAGEYTQGFLTDKDRFVDRKEAMQLAKKSGQVPTSQSFEELFSEDIY